MSPENPSDILTKPLAWAKLSVFVEPSLDWKGDTKDHPGSPDPEGSITGHIGEPVTSPSHGQRKATSLNQESAHALASVQTVSHPLNNNQ